jgi:rfaE bifunctional protein nucleotidyltransferase chain/domain
MTIHSTDREVGPINIAFEKDIFTDHPNPEAKIITDHDQLVKYIDQCRLHGLSIVMTSGSFDMVHIGHARYLEAAKKHGDILVVGVDSDAKVKARKGPERPVIPEDERIGILSHLRSVDALTFKYPDEPQWELIKRIAPDTLVVTEETYKEETLDELRDICGKVVCLEPQATTSTSAQIRKLQTEWSKKITAPMTEILEKYGASDALKRELFQIALKAHQNNA